MLTKRCLSEQPAKSFITRKDWEMATRKWFGLAAVIATVGGAIGYLVTKVRKGRDGAAVVLRRSGGDAEIDAEMETAAS